MADTDIWMPLYVDDYIADTRHLSTAEHGAYFLLILHAWRRDGKLPGDNERLRRIAGMSAREWKASWPTLRELFREDSDGFRHKRVDQELGRSKQIRQQRSDAGKSAASNMTAEQRKARAKAAAEARWKANEDANDAANDAANEMRTACLQNAIQPQPQPQPQEKEEDRPPPTLNAAREISEPAPHGALAFSGGVVRVNHRDYAAWEKTYHGIPDLRATLTALDEWVTQAASSDHTVVQRWRRMVTGQLDKKHQQWLAELRKADDGEWEMPIC